MGEEGPGLPSSSWIGPGVLEVSPLNMENGKGIGLKRKMIIYTGDTSTLSCLWDLGNRCIVLGKLFCRAGPWFSHL